MPPSTRRRQASAIAGSASRQFSDVLATHHPAAWCRIRYVLVHDVADEFKPQAFLRMISMPTRSTSFAGSSAVVNRGHLPKSAVILVSRRNGTAFSIPSMPAKRDHLVRQIDATSRRCTSAKTRQRGAKVHASCPH